MFLLEKLERSKARKENKRAIATAFLITTGPFAGHRLYLGTEVKVPVIYTITVGGGLGVLPLIDLGAILFSKDLSRFEQNGNVFMWVEEEAPTPQ